MDRQQILNQYTDEILDLIKMKVAEKDTIMAALNCALTEYAIVLIQIQQKAIIGERKDD